MRCAECGARNPEGAEWCTQCFVRFGGPALDRSSAPSGAPVPADGAGAPTGGTRVASPEPARDIREREGLVEWRCPICEGWTALEVPACTSCGAPRLGFGDDRPAEPARDIEPTTLLAASILLPGLGHVLAGRVGTGVARIVLYVLWVGGGLALLLGSGGATLLGVVLLLGALVLWAGTLVDVQQLARPGGGEVLGPRALGLLVGAVTLLMVLSAFAAAPSPTGG